MAELPKESTSVAEAAEAALRTFEQEKHRMADLQEALAGPDTEVRAKDRSFAMTFDGRGELVGMKFANEKYRSMPPAKLAAMIVETAKEGRNQVISKLSEQFPMSLPGVDFGDVMTGKADPKALIDSILAPVFGDIQSFFPEASDVKGEKTTER